MLLISGLGCCVSKVWANDPLVESSSLRQFVPQNVLEWTSSEADAIFTRETIFDYMDGAGEVYLAYDFEHLFVRQYAKPSAPPIVVELYQMRTSADAYGIFSHDNDGERVDLGAGALYGGGYLRFWKGTLFVRVMADRETPDSKAAVLALGKMIADAINQDSQRPELLAYLPPDGLLSQETRYFHSLVSLNIHYYLADENLLNVSEQTNIALATYRLADQKVRLLLVQYQDPELAQSAFEQFAQGYVQESPAASSQTLLKQLETAQWVSARRTGKFIIVVLEAPDQATCAQLTEATVTLLGGKAQ